MSEIDRLRQRVPVWLFEYLMNCHPVEPELMAKVMNATIERAAKQLMLEVGQTYKTRLAGNVSKERIVISAGSV